MHVKSDFKPNVEEHNSIGFYTVRVTFPFGMGFQMLMPRHVTLVSVLYTLYYYVKKKKHIEKMMWKRNSFSWELK